MNCLFKKIIYILLIIQSILQIIYFPFFISWFVWFLELFVLILAWSYIIKFGDVKNEI